MASSGTQWTWSAQHQDYYYVTPNGYGGYIYHWAKQSPTTAGASSSSDPSFRPRGDSGSSQTPDTNALAMPEPISPNVRTQLQLYDFIPGTPERGWYEPLDSSYRMRSGAEMYQFFQIGKVFAMLHIQAASEQMARNGNDNVSIVQYGQAAFSQIRRFVVVDVRRGFVYACPISTYSGRATLKAGCNAREHSAVYFVGTHPMTFQGENLTKEPIAIQPAEPGLMMHAASRLQFGKAYPIEMNVKVKDIGNVIHEDLNNLATYYAEETNRR